MSLDTLAATLILGGLLLAALAVALDMVFTLPGEWIVRVIGVALIGCLAGVCIWAYVSGEFVGGVKCQG